MRGFLKFLTLCFFSIISIASMAGDTFYVSTSGVDNPANGTMANPWATLTFALDQVSDGSLILVRPGNYSGRIRIRGIFPVGVTVRSEIPYQAILRHNSTVFTVFENAQGITLSGFDVAHSGAGASALVVQIQDANQDDSVHGITIENSILHDSFNNDILKINNSARDIIVRNNIFYNQQGSDEHIDVNSVKGILIEGNIFFNDFSASGRTNNNDTASYIVVKDSNGSGDIYLGSEDITIRRNLFFNWQGSIGANFVLCGEDGQDFHEAFNMLVENNLMLGNSGNPIRAPFGVKGCRDVTFRANTVVGDMPSNAFAMRLNREGSNPQLENILLYNNIWSDPTGTMNDFSDTPISDTLSFTLSNNQFFNDGNALPEGATDLVNPPDDSAAVISDPGLALHAGLITPVWVPGNNQFKGGYANIIDAFTGLVNLYAVPAANSTGIDQADNNFVPADDILGNPRDSMPDIGAYESVSTQFIFANGFEESIMTFFVTSTGNGAMGGDLGGLSGADAQCQNLATNGGAGSRTWHAYLSTDSPLVNARDRIGSGPWFNQAGTMVAANLTELHNNITGSLLLDEEGQPVPSSPLDHDILTGSTTDGNVMSGKTCNNWTDGTDASGGQVGHADIAVEDLGDESWNSQHDPQCSESALASTAGTGRIYCFAIN